MLRNSAAASAWAGQCQATVKTSIGWRRPATSAPAGWWNLRGVSILDRTIWPGADGNCPAGPPRCVTSVAALRAAQEAGQASIDVPSNLYFYLTVHPETR